MPGRMGGNQVTIQNVKVLKVDKEKGLLVVNGCVAGPNGCVVKVQDAIKKPWPVIPERVAEVQEVLKALPKEKVQEEKMVVIAR